MILIECQTKRWASNEGWGQYGSKMSHVQSCFYAAVAHVDILQSPPNPCTWVPEHIQDGQALAFWRATAIFQDPWVQHKYLKSLYPQPNFWVIMQNCVGIISSALHMSSLLILTTTYKAGFIILILQKKKYKAG